MFLIKYLCNFDFIKQFWGDDLIQLFNNQVLCIIKLIIDRKGGDEKLKDELRTFSIFCDLTKPNHPASGL